MRVHYHIGGIFDNFGISIIINNYEGYFYCLRLPNSTISFSKLSGFSWTKRTRIDK